MSLDVCLPRDADSETPATTGLPAPDTALVGREPEIARLAAMLDVPGLVTVTGEGGVGKTRLVLEVARRLTRPVAFVALADLDRTGATLAIRREWSPLLLSRFDAATGTLREGPRDLPAVADEHDPRVLVLDSVEQVGQISDLIAEIRATVPDMTILVTSRSRLGLSNERVLHLVGLPATPDGPAVELFLARSRAVGADPAALNGQLPAVAQLCRALDGLPLAIELAAARTRMMSPTALLAQVHSADHRRMLTLLAKGPTDLPKRQLSMRATLAWSHRLLDPADQVLFRRLGVFPGSFSLESAEAVVGGDDSGDDSGDDVLDGIAEMVDLHLVEPVESATDPERVRFIMSDVARAFAGELLAASGDGPRVRVRLQRWCRVLVARADRGLASVDERLWMDRLDREMPIIRQCLSRCAADGEAAAGLELAVGLSRYWALRAQTNEGMQWLETFLKATEGADEPGRPTAPTALSRTRIAALGWWSRLAIGSGDLARVSTGLQSMRQARPAAIDPACTFEWLTWTDNLVLSLLIVGEAAECGGLIADGLRVAEARHDPYWTCVFLLHRALWRWTSVGQREDRLAQLWAEVAVMATTDNGLARLAARARSLSAMNLMARREWAGAHESMSQSLDGARLGGDARSHSVTLSCLGAVMVELGRPQEAARYLVEAITEAKHNDDRLGKIGAAWAVSFLACRLGRHADVAVAHDTVVDHLGLLERLLPATLLDDYRLAVTVGKPSGSGDRGETAVWGWLCGWALGIASDIAARPPVDPPLALPPADVDPIDDVVAVRVPTKVIAAAATSATPSSTPSRTRLHPHDLTARELEILAAIASGRTNAQIATDFFLSTKTVMHHSVSIYRKLDVRGRAEAVALAYRTGLLAPSGE
jgi:predicted ATPase/DNA-binding CsgD family transcriptional regulator